MRWSKGSFINIGGVNVHFIDVGEGPAVLLLHGLGTSLITWDRNVEPLAEAGYRVLALDLPGHGDSDKPRTLSYDPISGANLLRQFLTLRGVEQASVVGSSAGGLVVGQFAIAYPEQVDRMVLVAAGGLGREVCWFLRVMSIPVLGELLYQPRLRNAIDLAKHIFYQEPPFLNEVLPEMRRVRNMPGTSYAALRAVRSSINLLGLRKQQYILHRLTDLSKPLMAVWGKEDSIIPAVHAEEVRRAIPNSCVRIIPQCGHWPHMEKAEEFNELLVQFFNGSLDNGHRHPNNETA
jgi:pimeloyl-ACP methyl ester carboxylesterase